MCIGCNPKTSGSRGLCPDLGRVWRAIKGGYLSERFLLTFAEPEWTFSSWWSSRHFGGSSRGTVGSLSVSWAPQDFNVFLNPFVDGPRFVTGLTSRTVRANWRYCEPYNGELSSVLPIRRSCTAKIPHVYRGRAMVIAAIQTRSSV